MKRKDLELMSRAEQRPAEIGKIRRQIDVVDRQIMRLLSRRFQLSRRMGILKNKTGTAIIDTGREKQIYGRLLQMTKKSVLDSALVLGIWKNIIRKSYQIQRQVYNINKTNRNNGKKKQTG